MHEAVIEIGERTLTDLRWRTLPFPEEISRYYTKVWISEQDLAQAEFCCQHLIKKRWHNKEWERHGTVYMQQAAYTSALITAYSRPFTRSRGLPMLKGIVEHLSAEEAGLHDEVLTLRHQLYAHSDAVHYSVKPIVFGDGTSSDIERRPNMLLTAQQASALLSLIRNLRKLCWNTLEGIRSRYGEGDPAQP